MATENIHPEGEVGTPAAQGASGEPKTALEYHCKWFGCRLVSTGVVRRPKEHEHFLDPSRLTGNKASFDFQKETAEILRHVGAPSQKCIKNGIPKGEALPKPSPAEGSPVTPSPTKAPVVDLEAALVLCAEHAEATLEIGVPALTHAAIISSLEAIRDTARAALGKAGA